MKLTLLGTGTPAPSLTRQSSGYVIEAGNDVIVLDHGPGACHRLLEAGYRLTDVSHVFLTHLHYDHMMDYPRLILQRWDQGAGEVAELEVFGPAPVKRLTEQMLAAEGLFGLDVVARTSHAASLAVYEARGGVLPRRGPQPAVREVSAGDVIEGADWKVTVGQAVHFQPYLECFGYRIETAEGAIAYSGDSGGVLESMIDLAAGCDVLVHMCHFESGTEPSAFFRKTNGNHMDVAAIADRAGVGCLVLTHIPPPLDVPGVMERLVQEMRSVYSGTVIIGRDLLQVPLKPSQRRRID